MRTFFYTLCLGVAMSCNSTDSFDAARWKQQGVDWALDDARERMVVDLIASDTLVGMRAHDVQNLLGNPDIIDSAEQCYLYLIREKYDHDIDPTYISYLHVCFDTNRMVQDVRMEK